MDPRSFQEVINLIGKVHPQENELSPDAPSEAVPPISFSRRTTSCPRIECVRY